MDESSKDNPTDESKFLSLNANVNQLKEYGLILLGFLFVGVIGGLIKADSEDWSELLTWIVPVVLIALIAVGIWKWRTAVVLAIGFCVLVLILAIFKWAFGVVF